MKDNEEGFMISLHFDGKLIKNGDSLTARTLGHSLQYLQRMIDKSLLFEKRGSIKKRDTLPTNLYPLADVVVKPFKKGCVTVPLVGLSDTKVISRLKGLIHSPYENAISDQPLKEHSLNHELAMAFNRAVYKIGMLSHDDVIKDAAESERRYFAEGVLRDFDNLISPLRSSAMTSDDLISIELKDSSGTREFEFNPESSRRFHHIVSRKQLGPVVLYVGRLVEFGETKSRTFPYSGRFLSNASKQEHKLLVMKGENAEDLRSYNTAKEMELRFLGAPMTAWGTFDEQRGDIVFLKLLD